MRCFDASEIVLRERMVAEIQVVVEPDIDRGPDAELRAREERLDCFGHEVGGTVPVGTSSLPHPSRSGCGPMASVRQRTREIPRLAIHGDGECLAGEAFADALGDLRSGRAAVIRPLRAVRKCYGDRGPCLKKTCILKKMSLTSGTRGTYG